MGKLKTKLVLRKPNPSDKKTTKLIQKRDDTKKTTRSNNMDYYVKVLQNYATFSGRARRSEFWSFFLINFIISFALGFILGLIKLNFIASLYSLAVLVPSIAVGVRRMQDIGKPGWYIIIPIYNIILAATEGEKGSNQYGPDPKATN